MMRTGESRRTFLVTGTTGFLGKVVLEELLRRADELQVERAYVLIRPRDGADAAARFEAEVAGSPCLRLIPEGWRDRVTVVEGSLETPGLALEHSVQAELERRVTHVIHAAASVDFDLPLAEAARANILTSLNLLEVVRSFGNLQRMVYVSTAYVTPHSGRSVPIEEVMAPLPRRASEIYAAIEAGRADQARLLAESGHPNTYTLTKSLAEHLLVERRGKIPLAIIRPSIISAARQHPFPGWIDSLSGFGAFALLIGLGHLRAMIGRPRARLDLVPVDEVVARVLDAGTTGEQNGKPRIVHAVAGLSRAPTVNDCWREVLAFFRVHRVARRPVRGYVGPGGLPFALAHGLHHRLPIAVGALTSGDLRRRSGQLRGRLSYLNRVFPYFTTRSFDFRSSAPLDSRFHASPYVRTVCRGIYRNILKRTDAEWPLAGRRHKGHGGDLRWALRQPRGNLWVRFAAWLVTKVLRRSVDRVTVDIPSFEAARNLAAPGSAFVVLPNHRSYLDFVLCSYLIFARPDLGIPIPHIAATMEFGRIPILGRILKSLHAFYLRRGEGKPDPDLTRRVHALIREGRALEFFIEGTRSRSREFLPPKRGLLRCLQATGKTFTLLPVAFSYDRVPEERLFAEELGGASKPRMRLWPLLRWTWRVWRGRVNLGRVHIACGAPVPLHPDGDVHEVSTEVIRRLREATVATTFHLRAWLHHHGGEGLDVEDLRRAIERRGGRVLESELSHHGLSPLVAATLRHQFVHHFETDEELRRLLSREAPEPEGEPAPVA